ncbi:mitotic spindle biogenesis protein Spc19 [Blastomyces gilchristii SLH14081]|uniref:DASH complex subunit SPC19 n=1 Tax=Blastomyces gilchristii (strain SLH14081) TaxID=559298 RepID=A0A179U7F6_BLAGS|nr:mitotic spindle biogenesis protein Spc19 [Blastomyces gilchristii SLH14081]OAT03750.1 mitotic spindle biogenesis protein Spc19 [Blastomyces gilchristii SLH14081]
MATSLSSSVSSLQASLQLLESSINILDEGVSDFPRLRKVLQTTRHFELLPEPTVREAQKAIHDEINPSIAHLLSLASNHVEKLARREQSLKAKYELQQGRLSYDGDGDDGDGNGPHASRRSNNSHQTRRPLSTGRSVTETAAAGRAAELRKLVQKKERLQYTVERLELQSKQRERQLRKSMAAQ